MGQIRKRVYEIIAEPPEGDRLGNFVTGFILVLIAVNVTIGILETIDSLNSRFPQFFYWFEFVSVMIFSVEYVLRLWSCTSQKEFSHPIHGRVKMATRPMSIIDFLAIAPFYLQFLLPAGMDLRFIRILRLFRLFRLFRMGSLMKAVTTLKVVFGRKKEELSIAILVLLVVVLFSASLMYLAESGAPDTKFTSIPQSMWWAIVTVTTIGYGDMYPETPIGQVLGAFIGFIGVCVFALPVAILGAGFIEEVDRGGLGSELRSLSEANRTKEDSGDAEENGSSLELAKLDDATLEALAERVAEKVIAKLDK